MISLVKKDYDSTKIYRKTHKKGASQTYDTPSFYIELMKTQRLIHSRELFDALFFRHLADKKRSVFLGYNIAFEPLNDNLLLV